MRSRTVLIFLLVLVALPVAALAVLSQIDLNRYKPMLSRKVENATGRDLQIDGELRVGWSLWPTILIEDAALANAPWGTRPQMLEVARIEAEVDLLALLTGNLVINRVTLEGADILLERDQDGTPNWAFSSGRPSTGTDDRGGESGGFQPLVREVEVVASRITYLPPSDGVPLVLALDELEMEGKASSEPAKIEGRGQLAGQPLAVRGSIGPMEAIARDGETVQVDLTLEALGATSRLSGTLQGPLAARQVEAELHSSAPSLDGLAPALALPPALVQLLQAAGPMEATASLKGDISALGLHDVGIKSQIGGLDVKVQGGFPNLRDPSTLDLAVSLQGHDLRGLQPLLGGRAAPEGPVHLEANIRGLPQAVAIQPLSLELGQSDLEGELTLAWRDPRPKISGSFTASTLVLPVSRANGGGEGKRRGRLFSGEPLPFAELGLVDVDLDMKVAELRMPDLTVSETEVGLYVEDGGLEAPVQGKLGGGTFDGSLSVQATDSLPRLALALTASQVGLSSLLPALGAPDVIEAPANLKLDLEGAGLSPDAIAASLAGHVTGTLGAGEVRAQSLDILVGGITEVAGALFGADLDDALKVDCAAFDLPVSNGIAEARLLVASTGVSTLRGEGEIDLAKERLDLVITPHSKSATLNLAVPVRIEGPLVKPSLHVDSGAVVARTALGVLGALAFPPAALGAFTDLGDTANPCLDPGKSADSPSPSKDSSGGLENDASRVLEKGREALEGLLGGRR